MKSKICRENPNHYPRTYTVYKLYLTIRNIVLLRNPEIHTVDLEQEYMMTVWYQNYTCEQEHKNIWWMFDTRTIHVNRKIEIQGDSEYFTLLVYMFENNEYYIIIFCTNIIHTKISLSEEGKYVE